jgi:hypothetical protein
MDYFTRTIFKIIEKNKGAIPTEKSMIILGCGRSPIPRLLFDRFHPERLDMLDYNPECVSYQKKNLGDSFSSRSDHMRIIHGDITKPEIIDLLRPPYHVILFTEVLEHIHDDISVLHLIGELMSQDSILILSVPNGWIDNLLLRINRNYMKLSSGSCGHVRFYNRKIIENLLNRSGLKVQRFIPINAGFTFFHLAINLMRIPVDGDYGAIKCRNIFDKMVMYSGSILRILTDTIPMRCLFNRFIARNLLFVVSKK